MEETLAECLESDYSTHSHTTSSSSQSQQANIEKLLECALCLSLICEPITISCGHTFCKVCLVKSLKRSHKKCPTCRSVCHISAEDATENIMIKNLAILLNSELYSQRLAETVIEKASWNLLLPIL